MIKEGRGVYGSEVAPGVFEIADEDGVHVSTVKLIKDGYVVTFLGDMRKQVYAERAAIRAKLAERDAELVPEDEYKQLVGVSPPNWV